MANNVVLNQIKIRGLYGLYGYDLDFTKGHNLDVRFITAPNGFGKSTILKIIEAFFKRSLHIFVNPKLRYEKIEFDLLKYRVVFTQKSISNQDENSDEDTDYVESVIEVFKSKGKTPIETTTINSVEVHANNSDLLPKTINIYLNSKHTHLVADNRLWIHKENDIEQIVKLTNIIKDIIEKKDAEISNRISEFLSFYMINQPAIDNNLEQLCKKTCRILSRFHKVGIALKFSESMLMKDSPLRASYIRAINDSINGNDLDLRRLEQLANWINKCEFANKRMILRKEEGLIFEALDADNSKILPEELSSGEKQIVVQAIELLFCTQKGSIVLIDEPELSYHVAWQMIYFEQIISIAKLCKLQCIIATHNPQMFNFDWDLSIDLFTQYENFHNQQ